MTCTVMANLLEPEHSNCTPKPTSLLQVSTLQLNLNSEALVQKKNNCYLVLGCWGILAGMPTQRALRACCGTCVIVSPPLTYEVKLTIFFEVFPVG